MIRPLFLATAFLSGILAANAFLGRSITMTALALSIAIVGLVCARTGDRMSRRTIRILSIVAGAGSAVAAVHVSTWFVLAVVACAVMYLRNGDEPKRVLCANRFDSIVTNWCMASECACGLPMIPPPPPRARVACEDDDCPARVHRITRAADGSIATVEPMFPMSPMDREEQRRSFAYGNASISNPSITRADIDRAANDVEPTLPGAA